MGPNYRISAKFLNKTMERSRARQAALILIENSHFNRTLWYYTRENVSKIVKSKTHCFFMFLDMLHLSKGENHTDLASGLKGMLRF